MFKDIVIAGLVSWCIAVSLGTLFAATTSGRVTAATLRLPGIIPVMLIGATLTAVVFTPLVWWAFKPARKASIVGGVCMLCVLVAYILIITPQNVRMGLVGTYVLTIIGLVVIRIATR
jgi:hypothetical protein